jgi:hypothetical protein
MGGGADGGNGNGGKSTYSSAKSQPPIDNDFEADLSAHRLLLPLAVFEWPQSTLTDFKPVIERLKRRRGPVTPSTLEVARSSLSFRASLPAPPRKQGSRP